MEPEGDEVTEGTGEVTEPVETGGEPAPEQTESLNPAWNPLLEKLPSSLHPMITPVLREWDSGVQNKLQSVQSQYDPYKAFVDNKVDPEALEQAYGLYNLINENPELVYKQMQEFYGYGGQGQEPSNENNGAPADPNADFDFNAPDADITQHPKFQELLQNQQAIAQVIMEQQQEKEYAAINQSIESELATVKAANPNIDELMLFQTAVGAGLSLTDAAAQLNAYNESLLTSSKRPAPTVFSGSGGGTVATQQPDPTKMDHKQTKQTVAAILAANAQANGE